MFDGDSRDLLAVEGVIIVGAIGRASERQAVVDTSMAFCEAESYASELINLHPLHGDQPMFAHLRSTQLL